jgi:DNA topoisomerase IB
MRIERSDPDEPGIRRVGRGRGFSYHRPDGRLIRDARELERIRSLAIPPAWREVWICPDDCGHIQAIGTDAAGRRQYLYHPDWRAQRDREKFERLVEFGATMPAVRRRLAERLELQGLVRERVLAGAVRLLDIGLFRVGGEAYAEDNESFGLTTLEKRHVRVRRGAIEFEYVAKGGALRTQTVEDELVLPTVVALRRRRAPAEARLLVYRDGRSAWRELRSDELNEHLKELVGERFSAKDFRTWNATVLAAAHLAARAGEEDRDRAVAEAIERVAEALGNTPAVCRDSYVDPRVIERFEDDGRTIAPALRRLNGAPGFARRERIESAVLRLLR